MSLYKHCDNPDCNSYEKASGITSFGGDGWIKIEDDLDFCSWRCVQVFAHSKLPKVLM